MPSLADTVLPLIRTRADLHRWRAADAHGAQMHEAIDRLEAALPEAESVEAYQVTQKALSSAILVIARADDSSGIIGDACRRLLALHPRVAASASDPVSKVVPRMIRFKQPFCAAVPGLDTPSPGPSGSPANRPQLRDRSMRRSSAYQGVDR